MHFVSFVASERKNGNCDLIGRLAVRCALKSGVDSGEIVYLRNFDIKQCRGCLQCVFEGKKCSINDDLYKLLDIFQEADKLLLVAPVYVLSIPGKLKSVLDRFLAASRYLEDTYGKHAMSIGVAALNDWHQFQLPMMNLLLLALGRHIVNSFFIYGAGPGEVLLEKKIKELPDLVNELVHHKKRPFESTVSEYCPIDFSRLFEHVDDDNYRCPVCLTPAKKVVDGFYFEGNDLNNHRWTKHKIEEHFINWILKTKPRFKSKLKEIIKQKRELGI
jgi:multimeric flavodoxin WrbA